MGYFSIRRYSSRSAFENALILSFFFILTGVLLGYFKKYEDVVKKTAAYQEVYHINTAVVLYTVKNKKFPDDLKALVKEEHLIMNDGRILKRKYIEGVSADKEGYPLDPWGRRYKYDRARGIAEIEG